MRVLVTGGAGFIGSRLVHRLLAAGRSVAVLDDLSSGTRSAVPDEATFVAIDVADPATTSVVADLRPDAVVHLAAQVSVPRSLEDPLRDLDVNVRGTIAVLAGARVAGARRFVFASSGGAAYGNVARLGGATEDAPPSPLSPYGIHKVAAELHVVRSGLGHAIARLANVYGPGQRSDLEGGVVAIFAERIASREPLVIHGDGEQRRDFVHVDDVATALMLMLNVERSGTWNVGTGVPTSINELARVMNGSDSFKANHVPGREGDVRESVLNVDRLVRDFGWRPGIQLESGIRGLLPGVSDRSTR